VVAQNATLSLEPANDQGVSIKRVLGSTYARDVEGSIVLGDLLAEEEKDVLIELALPMLAAPVEATPALHATLRAFNVGRCAPDAVHATLQLARPLATPVDQPINTELDAQRNRIETAEAMETATLMADAGDLEGGRAIFRACKAKIAESASSSHQLSQNLVNECEQLEANYRTLSAYHSVGGKMSKMHAMSHCHQRSVHTNAGAYLSGAKRKASMKAKWMSSLQSTAHGGSGSDSD